MGSEIQLGVMRAQKRQFKSCDLPILIKKLVQMYKMYTNVWH
jgi:hypothetical protein